MNDALSALFEQPLSHKPGYPRPDGSFDDPAVVPEG
ncbi:hypothetical protein SEA_MILANI_7 [Microbacterium phage Milani]|nr:hypothetical protein SEA_MILANI_7 [Microbacterium phage Milani]